jgi:VIT1/CCC1 family predicted Fe2+/Mn2+ transporter
VNPLVEKLTQKGLITINTEVLLNAYLGEHASAQLYETMAEVEKDPRLAEVFRRIAKTELRHAEKWAAQAKEAGVALPEYKPSWRTRVLMSLSKRFGPGMILPVVQSLEQTGTAAYAQMEQTLGMAADEQSHARLMNVITHSVRGGIEGGVLMQLEGRHRSTGGNALRAAVMGANDGLVSNLSLVMGVAGAEFQNSTILITGLAGLLAGAFSMALGEWLSVQSSRELYQHQIAIEEAEIASAPEEEVEELALIYEARGMSKQEAQKLAKKIFEDPSLALETLAREELNIDPAELGGSAWEAAITSFFLFAIGAIIPVIAFTFLSGMAAVIWSLLISAVGLFIIGTGITLFTGRSILFSGSRQVIFGLTAAVITFGIGRLIGVNLGG